MHATIVADTLVDANLRGIDTHGVVRLDTYLDRIDRGGIDTDPDVVSEQFAPGCAVVDADGGPGQVGMVHATKKAMELAASNGCAFVGVTNSNHFGTASYFTNMAAKEGFIGISMTHAAPNVVPFGGVDPYFGTNPLSFGLPSGLGFPVTLDMATSVTAQGDVILAEEEGEEIPPEWAIDENGEPITNPERFHALRPVGGPKGYGLALIVDVFCGVLLDAAFGRNVRSMYGNMSRSLDLGHVAAAVDIDSFTDLDEFKTRVSMMANELKAVDTRDGVDEVLLPGEPEHNTEQRRRHDGIPLGSGIRTTIEEIADTKGITPPKWIRTD